MISIAWFSCIPQKKGGSSLQSMVTALTRHSLLVGPEKLTIRGDGEPALRTLLAAVQAARKKMGADTDVQHGAPGSHQSQGLVERHIQTIRRFGNCLRWHAEDHYKAVLNMALSPVAVWAYTHACFLHNRFAVRKPSGCTPYESLHSKPYRGKLQPFAETVFWHSHLAGKSERQWYKGVWVAKLLSSDAHMV